MVRAKVQCVSEKKTTWGRTYEFNPVTSGSPENESFFATTPGGKIELTVKAEGGVSFEVGKFYYVDFTEAEN